MKKNRTYSFILLFSLIIWHSGAIAQSESNDNVSDTLLLDQLIDEGWKTFRSDPSQSLKTIHEALVLAKKLDRYEKEAKCDNIIGIIYGEIGEYDSSLYYYEKSLTIGLEKNDASILSKVYANMGLNYDYQGIYDSALVYYFKALPLYEKVGSTSGAANTYANLGNTYIRLNSYPDALLYLNKALLFFEKLENKQGMANTLNSLGSIYSDIDSLKSDAMDCYEKSLRIKEELNDKFGIANTLSEMAGLSGREKNYEEELELLKKALEINRELGDQSSIAKTLINLGRTCKMLRKYNDALSFLIEALEISEETNNYIDRQQVYFSLAHTYAGFNNFEMAYEYKTLYSLISDTILNQEKQKQMIELQTKYETEKKQLQIEKMEKQKQLDDEINRKQTIISYSAFAGIIFLLVFSVTILRMFRQKRKANKLLAKQKDEIETQKDHITEIHDEIKDSISYAKRIQTAVLPTHELACSIMGEHFIIFRPHSIVSGDFYWATDVNDWLIVTAADCTGHGVPGAFMSMLGVSFLNEIVRKKEVTDASIVLNKLRSSVIEALQQTGASASSATGSYSGMKDGMDMSIVAIHKDRKKALWAGANNPLWIIRREALSSFGNNSEDTGKENEDSADLIEVYKGDSMPVAVHVKMDNFTNHEIKINTGDMLYLFSDGYPDQFGGAKGKKFKYKPFKRLLVENAHLDMNAQREKLEDALDEWMGYGPKGSGTGGKKYEQVDDITVIGLKIPECL